LKEPAWKLGQVLLIGLKFTRVLAYGSCVEVCGPTAVSAIAEVVVKCIILDDDDVDAVHAAVELLLDQ
jgi:hypothetical protein